MQGTNRSRPGQCGTGVQGGGSEMVQEQILYYVMCLCVCVCVYVYVAVCTGKSQDRESSIDVHLRHTQPAGYTVDTYNIYKTNYVLEYICSQPCLTQCL
jgi:hypothetical protein